jgi:hypothetical protein
MTTPTSEELRLAEDLGRKKNWKRWGPYLAERQWATVREDYSNDGDCWNYFPHDHARSRAYRWGEDGLLGIADRECRLCFAVALWNGKDPILKERLFGLTNTEGNHGEDVKELYYYLDSTPTHSYMKALYKYPQAEFPYRQLVEENRKRSRLDGEFEITDTGAFDGNRYFDVTVEYAKADVDDVCIRITAENRGPKAADLTVLPTLWSRNSWSWGCTHEGCELKPYFQAKGPLTVMCQHATLGDFYLAAEPQAGQAPELLFTENETNIERLFGAKNASPYVKDAFHRYIVSGEKSAVNPEKFGTKAAFVYRLRVPAGGSATLRLRLTNSAATAANAFGDFAGTFATRVREADEFYARRLPEGCPDEPKNVIRQAYAGLLWSKQFYHYVVKDWRHGDPDQPPPPAGHRKTRNTDWPHLFSRDVISMPDTWEYPWFAAWDLAFHMLAFARVDPAFAKGQLELILREWYMNPNGQIPAYEFAFSDVNPPVHAWAVWRVYKMTGPRDQRDTAFLERCFHKLMLNFTWWVNRKDVTGKHLFSGGFLGLDNIGIFDRSKPLPGNRTLEQADGTAWMAFYCSTMLAMALELAQKNPAYEDIASKFFEHFVSIVDAINTLGGSGLWDGVDGFYYDHIRSDGHSTPLRVRSAVGLIPLLAAEVFVQNRIDRLPGFAKRMRWFLEHRPDLAKNIAYMECTEHPTGCDDHYLLAVPSRERLEKVLSYMLSEAEFLSPHGIRSVSRVHLEKPYEIALDGEAYSVKYCPGESDTTLFGGNSNWRGPVWMPLNFLLIEALERYHHFYGDHFSVEYPTGSGRRHTLHEIVADLRRRLVTPFLPDPTCRRPCHGRVGRYATDPHFKNLLLFHEYFHGDTGEGLGASHQTGWTALVGPLLEDLARRTARAGAAAQK